MTNEEAQRGAILSLMDVVAELAQGLANGQTPDPEWGDLVHTTFEQHRIELREATP